MEGKQEPVILVAVEEVPFPADLVVTGTASFNMASFGEGN